ncbi:cation transporter [Amorphus sp. 3PC139-8]|uniref:cation transporter n=1 Tax=Amorphus sp. 3PC139-8 TaxID=2735676 RepID=UPI00345D328A
MPCCSDDSCSSREEATGRFRAVLWIVLGINAAMFLVEIVAGLAAGSAALQADALDFLADAANYGISLFVLGLGVRWRAGAALVKGGSMGSLAFGSSSRSFGTHSTALCRLGARWGSSASPP